MSFENIIGKLLWEVRKKYKEFTIRIVRAGDVKFAHTMDCQMDRLNVELEGKGLRFEEQTFQVENSICRIKKLIPGSEEDGIVVAAYWG